MAPVTACCMRRRASYAAAIPAFAFIGSYADAPDGIHVKISTQRHNDDPALKPLFGTDMITLTLKGRQNGDMVDFEGGALQLPGVLFKAVLTRICD